MATKETDLSETDKNDNVCSTFNIFYPLFAQVITSCELTSSLKLRTILSNETIQSVRVSKDNDQEKVRKILELIEQSEQPDKLKTFSDILVEEFDMTFVPEALCKQHETSVQSRLENIVKGLKDEDIDSENVSKELLSHKLIDEKAVQDIGTECVNHGEKAALIVLIDRVVTPPPDSWYNEFLSCLIKIGKQNAVNIIEGDQFWLKSAGNSDKVEENYCSEEYWEKFVLDEDLFRGFLVNTVHPSHILMNLSAVFDPDEKAKIRQTVRRSTPHSAMNTLLTMFKEKDSPGKWQAFREALNLAGYQYVVSYIESGDYNLTKHDEKRHLLSIFEVDLADKINPREIIGHLSRKKLISDQQREEVEAEQIHHGEQSATLLLLIYISSRRKDWYPKFMKILSKNNLETLVDKIDPDFWKEMNKENSNACESSEDEDYSRSLSNNSDKDSIEKKLPDKCLQSDTQQNYTSYGEVPKERKNNLSSPESTEKGDEVGDLHRATIQDISMDDNINAEVDDENTHEKQLAKSTINSLPLPASRKSQPITTTPEPENDSPEDNQKSLDSIQLQNLFESLDTQVTGKPKVNIAQPTFQNVDTDILDSDSDGENEKKEELKLRSYQRELAAPGVQGKNCIIVAPTGSGKTHVALKIIQDHMVQIRQRRNPKVVFLVEQSALARQQADQCKKYLHDKVKLITGEVQRNERLKSFSSWLQKRSILVVTAQLLVNALAEGDVQITEFSLLVFDECHHAHAKHSYNQIMQYYMEKKIKERYDRQRLPMIVGLTASVGVGRANTLDAAIDWIKTMMANMDAEELSTVRDYVFDLSRHVIEPDQIVKLADEREKNYFGEALGKIMEVTETYMRNSNYAKDVKDRDNVLKAPAGKGTDQYTQWISKLWRETAKISDKDAIRFYTTCRTYLDWYNRALIIYDDARVKDALNFLEENIRKKIEHQVQDETDTKMETLYKKSKDLLQKCVEDDAHKNPKLELLHAIVAKVYRDHPDSRGIIFVKTRDLVIAIANWMRETGDLKTLNPIKFVGAQAAGDKGGMTKNAQDNTLKYFREGRHKLIIATSVAEEGLDIQKCNLVIRYDHVTNEIAMVQARGRGRADGSLYYVIASKKKMTAEKEELNVMREKRMNQAIEHLQSYIHRNRDKFLKEIRGLQVSANIQRELENATKDGRIVKDFEFELRCGKCSQFVCMSVDIKKIQKAHHAVVNDEIAENIKTTIMPKPTFEDAEIKMGCGKVNCIKCGRDLGNIVIYKGAQFPVLKIENFIIADSHNSTDVYKKWKKVPFTPKALTPEDLLDRVNNGKLYVPQM